MTVTRDAPQREPQVSRELTSLEHQIKRAAENAERLGLRFANVLRIPPPAGIKDLSPKDSSQKDLEVYTPLAQRIDTQWRVLADVNDQVEDIIARAEN